MTIAMNMIECIDNRSYTKESIAELAASINEVGLIQPIRLHKLFEGEKYRVVAGRRRFRAMELLKTKILDDEQYIIGEDDNEELVAFSENFHRENLTLSEEVEHLAGLKADSMTIEELAAIVGKTPRWTALRLNLANLTSKWKEVLENRAEYPQWTPRLLEEIAKYPPKTQEAFESEINGVSTLEEITENMQENFERNLDTAVFSKHDCADCTKKSSCELLLFENESETCLDPECYVNKQVEFIENELGKMQESNSKIYQISGGYSGYNSPFSRFENQKLPSHAFDVEESGEPNAIYVSGEKAGQYCRIQIKEHAKTLADRLIITSPVDSANNESATVKKEKTLEEREEELKRKRTKRAIELMKEYVENTDSYETIILKHRSSKETVITLAAMFGTKAMDGYVHQISEKYSEVNRKLKSAGDAYNRHCWHSVKESIGNRLSQQLNQTLACICDQEAKIFCELLELDYEKLFFVKASEEIQPSKVLLEARAKIAEQAA